MAPLQKYELKYAGDPRRPADVRKFDPAHFSPEDFPPDAFILLSLSCGMAAMMMRFKWASLMSMIFVLISIANTRGREDDIKQIVSTLCVAGFAIFQIYVELPARPTQAVAATAAAAGT